MVEAPAPSERRLHLNRSESSCDGGRTSRIKKKQEFDCVSLGAGGGARGSQRPNPRGKCLKQMLQKGRPRVFPSFSFEQYILLPSNGADNALQRLSLPGGGFIGCIRK